MKVLVSFVLLALLAPRAWGLPPVYKCTIKQVLEATKAGLKPYKENAVYKDMVGKVLTVSRASGRIDGILSTRGGTYDGETVVVDPGSDHGAMKILTVYNVPPRPAPTKEKKVSLMVVDVWRRGQEKSFVYHAHDYVVSGSCVAAQ